MEKSFENKKIEKHIVYLDNMPVGAVSVHKQGEKSII